MTNSTMDWQNQSNYFQNIPDGVVSLILANNEYPWSPLENLTNQINIFFQDKENQGEIKAKRSKLESKTGELIEGAYFIKKSAIIKEDFIDLEFKIFISKDTFLEAGSTIKNHTIIEKNCEIRQGAYLRGHCFIGSYSVVGHTTEIKNSIFIRHVEAGHFAYIGNSIVGSYVNLGAGTKISNLEFRNFKDKKEVNFPEIPFKINNKEIKTGLSKFGAIIGDGCETGCNSVLSPFVFLSSECLVMPNLSIIKGVYPKGAILKSISGCKKIKL